MSSNETGKKAPEIRLSVRVSEEDKQLVKEVADNYGLTITEFLIRAAKYIKKHNPQLTISPKANSLAGANS